MLKTQLYSGRIKLSDHYGHDGIPVLETTTHRMSQGVFKTGTANAGTTIVVTPDGGGAIILTDIVLSSDKLNNGTVTVDFYDGTYTEIIVKVNVDFGVALAIPFAGHWEGWKSADIRLTASGAADAYLAVGYFKLSAEQSMSYDEWNARR